MIYKVYSMHDRLNGYFNIFFDQSDDIAKRGFLHALKTASPGSLFLSNPDDYSLYRLAEFDTESGVISPLPTPEFLIRGEKNDSSDR